MRFQSDHLGLISVDEAATIEFPEGLPGFEDCRRFVPLRCPGEDSLLFLQSLEMAGLCFLALPAQVARPDYELALSAEDLELLGFPEGARPVLGLDVVALAIMSLDEGQAPTANLLSPIVIHCRTRRAVQAIRSDQRYGCREPLLAAEALCS